MPMRDVIAAFAAARTEGRTALIAFLMAGDGEAGEDFLAMRAAVAAGADMIEVGWPFSDPIADGPTIQAAASRALGRGTSAGDVLSLTRRVKDELGVPVALLTYLNPLLSLADPDSLGKAGVDALVVPDLPLEEAAEFRLELARRGISLVPFAAPTSGPARLAAAGRAAGDEHFVYLVAVMGVTGQRGAPSDRLLPLLADARRNIQAPIAVGFGMGSPDAVRAVRGHADGVIVGSALVAALSKDGPAGVGRLVAELSRAAGRSDAS